MTWPLHYSSWTTIKVVDIIRICFIVSPLTLYIQTSSIQSFSGNENSLIFAKDDSWFLLTFTVVVTFPDKESIIYFFSSADILGWVSGESATVKNHIIVQHMTSIPQMRKAQSHPKFSMIIPSDGHVRIEPKEPPRSAATNFPFSSGGAQRDTKQCKLGYTTP